MPDAKPRTQTPLESLLDDNQRERLCTYLQNRIQAVNSQIGEFRRKRKVFEMQMEDNFTWRTGGRSRESYGGNEWAGSIFDEQNDSLNIVGGFAAFIVARAVDDFFGTEPYYTVFPEGMADDQLAASIQKHSEWKLRMSPWKDAALDAIDSAIGLGEGVIKQTWRREVDVFERRCNILHSLATGKPIVGPDGDYIFGPDERGNGADEMVPATVETPEGVIQGMLVTKYPPVPEDGFPGLIIDPADILFQEAEIEQTNISFNNVQANTVHYGDLLIPETEENLEDSTFVGQRCQMRLSELHALYSLDQETFDEFRNDTDEAKTEAAKPREQSTETSLGAPMDEYVDPLIELVECWVRHDPTGEGRQRRMMVLYATKQNRIVTMDYIANVTPEGKLPFQVIRAFKVKNRWYGRGYFEIYEKAQEFIDRHLNYVASRNRFHAQPVTFFDPTNLLESEETNEFRLEPGSTYRLKPGTKAMEVFQTFQFPDLDDRTWELMQMMIQVVQVRSGVTSAAQGEVSSLPSTSTATGIESILQSASTLARQPMNLMKGGLEKALLYAVKLIYSNMDRDEVFNYLEGDQQKVGTLEAARVKDLEMNVRLLLTRFKQRESLESAQKAIQTMQAYVMLPEGEKDSQRPLYVQVVKSLGFDNADSIVRPAIQQPAVDPTTGQPVLPQQDQPPQLPPSAA